MICSTRFSLSWSTSSNFGSLCFNMVHFAQIRSTAGLWVELFNNFGELFHKFVELFEIFGELS